MCQSDRDSSETIFLKYGTVNGIVINQKKGGSVEVEGIAAAKIAVDIETGFTQNRHIVKP